MTEASGTAQPTDAIAGGHRLVCVRCQAARAAQGYLTSCPACGGLLDAVYDLSHGKNGVGLRWDGTGPLSQFACLLPLPSAAISDGHGITSTPLIPLDAAAGIPVAAWAKWEGAHPTGSAKDPMAIVALAYLVASGVREFAFSSTGNTSAAYARALAAQPSVTGHLVAPAGFPVPAEQPPNLIVHEVPGDYTAAQHTAARFCAAEGVTAEGGFFSVGRREGLKLAYLEALLAAPDPPTVVVQAVSSGMGILAAAKAVAELDGLGLLARRPRLIAVQQQTCAPMAASFRAGSAALRPGDVISGPQGLAVAILLGDPRASYPYVRDAVAGSGGLIVSVPDHDILAAMTVLRARGLDPCFSSATAYGSLAWLYRHGEITDQDTVLVNLTGSAQSAAGRAELAAREAGRR